MSAKRFQRRVNARRRIYTRSARRQAFLRFMEHRF